MRGGHGGVSLVCLNAGVGCDLGSNTRGSFGGFVEGAGGGFLGDGCQSKVKGKSR